MPEACLLVSQVGRTLVSLYEQMFERLGICEGDNRPNVCISGCEEFASNVQWRQTDETACTQPARRQCIWIVEFGIQVKAFPIFSMETGQPADATKEVV